MAALYTNLFSPSATTTLGTTTTSVVDREGRVDRDALTTTATSASTTLSTSGVNQVNIQLQATRDYISQMSEEELNTMLLQMDEREQDILNAVDEVSKVKKIGTR